MEVALFAGTVSRAAVDLLVFGTLSDAKTKPPLLGELDRALGGALVAAIADEGYKGKPKHRLTLHTLGTPVPVGQLET